MGFSNAIPKQIAVLANKKKSSIKEKQFYESQNFASQLERIARLLTEKKISVKVVNDGKAGFTANTDGNTISINWNHYVFTGISTPVERYKAVMGAFYHELAHVIFLDFDGQNKAAKSIMQGVFFGDVPDRSQMTIDECDEADEFEEAFSTPEYRPIFLQIFGELANRIADRHDEDCMLEEYGSLCSSGIWKIRESLFSLLSSVEDNDNLIAKKQMTKLEAFYSLVLQYARFEDCFCLDQKSWDSNDLLKRLSKVAGAIYRAHQSDYVKDTFTELNRVCLAIWPYIKEELEKAGSQGKKGGNSPQGNGKKSGNQAPTPEPVQAVMDILNKASASVPNTSAPPKNVHTSKTAREASSQQKKNGFKEKNKSSQSPGEKATSDKKMEKDFESIVEAIATKKAEEEVEREIFKDTEKNIRTIIKPLDYGSPHMGVPVDVARSLGTPDEKRYDEIISRVGKYSKRLQQQILDALRDIREGGLYRHKPFGRIIMAGESYRPDGKYFANKKLPQDLPDMAIALLVDNSGSMYGDRIAAAQEAAVLLYDFATGLNIPVMCAGHNTMGNSVEYTVFSDFERSTRYDASRIANMSVSGSNRDGLALLISSQLLQQRSEEVKILIIISDGQPNHYGYSGNPAIEDIQSIVKSSKSKGIEVIAAAIGDDKNTISKIYGDGFLDIADLSQLPKKLTAIVKKRIMANAY